MKKKADKSTFYYVHCENNKTICLFSYQKATNKFVIIFNMIDSDISYYRVSDKLNNATNNFIFIQSIAFKIGGI